MSKALPPASLPGLLHLDPSDTALNSKVDLVVASAYPLWT
jgi:hypothetical protein